MWTGDEGRAGHAPVDELARFRRGELTPQRALEVGRHLATCPLCIANAARSDELQQSVHELQLTLEQTPEAGPDEEGHPDLNRELVGYVDGTLPIARRDAIAAHLTSCARCREDTEDLRDIQARIDPLPASRRVPVAIAAAAAIMVVAITALAIILRNRAPQLQPPNLRSHPIGRPAAPLHIDYGRADWNEAVRSALTTGNLVIAPPDLPSARGDTLRGTAARQHAAVHLEPNHVVIDEGRPRFRWPAADGSRYSVAVVEGDREVARSGTLRDAEWIPAHELPRGVVLGWQVSVENGRETTLLPSPPNPPAQFRITSAGEHAALAEARQKFAGDHILLAVLYARSGMRDAATTELQLSDRPEAARLLAGAN